MPTDASEEAWRCLPDYLMGWEPGVAPIYTRSACLPVRSTPERLYEHTERP